ncbi:MAG: prolipoprotein diacylglyceryl transferase family protein, partial [Candidatus Promineifilaceae bacterium]
LLAAAFGLRAARLPATAALDAAAPALLVGLLALSLADFLAGPGYGSESSLPWAVSLFGIRRHPVQVYEIGVGLLTLWAWLAWRPSRPAPGRLFLLSAAVYAAGRLFVDAFRADSPLTAGGYHLVQIACLVVLLLAVALLGRAGPTSAPAAPEPQGPSFAKPH